MKRIEALLLMLVACALIANGCGSKNETEAPSGTLRKQEAVLGVAGVRLSRTEEGKDDGAGIAAGTTVIVKEERGQVLRVRLPDGTDSWCRRAYLCTGKEWETRKTKQEIPKTVTFLGLGKNGSYKLYGNLQIRNNRVAILPGQALWLDEELCAAKPEMDWQDAKVPTRTDALYLVSDKGLTTLPAWPSNRTTEPAQQ